MEDDLVTVATYLTAFDAELAKGLLEDSGVDVFLMDQEMGRIYLVPMIGGIKLQVRRKDANLARDLLRQVQSGNTGG